MRWLGCPLDASLVRCSGHVPLGGDPGEDPGHVGETMSLSWPRAGGSGRGQGRLSFSAQAAAPATRPPEKQQMMDGWMGLDCWGASSVTPFLTLLSFPLSYFSNYILYIWHYCGH